MSEEREHPTISYNRHNRLVKEREERNREDVARGKVLLACFLTPEFGEARKWLELRIDGYRDELEMARLDEYTRAWKQGALAELRNILAVADGTDGPLRGATIDLLSSEKMSGR